MSDGVLDPPSDELEPASQQRPATLADVAREAGTSPSTASRALSGRGYVSPAARERLLAVADQLGYIPNESARTLKQQRSRVVGVVVSDLGNQFYARLAAGIDQALREAGLPDAPARRQQRERRGDSPPPARSSRCAPPA